MPYQILCNGTQQKSSEARPGLSLTPSRCALLYNKPHALRHTTEDENELATLFSEDSVWHLEKTPTVMTLLLRTLLLLSIDFDVQMSLSRVLWCAL